MRHSIALLLAIMSATTSMAQITETAVDAVKNMGLGWNLGNTLDANGCRSKDFTSAEYWGGQGLESEKYWGQPTTTADLFVMMKNAGFGAIRVPVTWYNHMDKDGKVDAKWMARVKEVVDYVIGNGMYCIVNVHHDTGADGGSFASWIKADESNYNTNKTRYEYLWKQIAEQFKDYDNHLLFEGYNEMLDIKNSWCFASFNATGQYDKTIATSAYKGLNSYGQSFVNVVRATGGNNATRNLVVNTYAAANGYGTWNSHLKEPLTQMALPEDNVKGHIIFEVHDYPNLTSNGSNRSISDIQKQVDGTISMLKTNLVSKGAPVIIGEWGTSNVDAGAGKTDYEVRRSLMFQFAEYYVKQCKANGIATFYWMGMTDGQYRSLPAFNQADLAECVAKAYHGSTFKGEYPTAQSASGVVAFEGEKVLGWGQAITIDKSSFEMVGYPVTLTITYQQTNNDPDIQFFYGDWSTKPSVIVNGKTYTGDFNPKAVYGTSAGANHTTSFTFSQATFNEMLKRGLLFQGIGITVYKVELSSTTGISMIENDKQDTNDAIYNLSGQRIAKPARGLYIKGGKVYIAK